MTDSCQRRKITRGDDSETSLSTGAAGTARRGGAPSGSCWPTASVIASHWHTRRIKRARSLLAALSGGRRRIVVLGLVTAALAACSSGDDPAGSNETTLPDARQLTIAEAELLAGALVKNYERGGASFSATANFEASGDRIELMGAIDWRNHVGAASVVAVGAEADVTEVLWTTNEVVESRVGLAEQLAADGYPGARFISRAPSPEARQIDGLLALVLGLATQTRDNPLLLQQDDSARYLREDEVSAGGRDVSVTVFRFGAFELWLDADGVIHRYSGSTSDGNRHTIIDFFNHGPVEITGPAEAEIAPGP